MSRLSDHKLASETNTVRAANPYVGSLESLALEMARVILEEEAHRQCRAEIASETYESIRFLAIDVISRLSREEEKRRYFAQRSAREEMAAERPKLSKQQLIESSFNRGDYQSALHYIGEIDYPPSTLKTLSIFIMCRFKLGMLDSLRSTLSYLDQRNIESLYRNNPTDRAGFFLTIYYVLRSIGEMTSDSIDWKSRQLVDEFLNLFLIGTDNMDAMIDVISVEQYVDMMLVCAKFMPEDERLIFLAEVIEELDYFENSPNRANRVNIEPMKRKIHKLELDVRNHRKHRENMISHREQNPHAPSSGVTSLVNHSVKFVCQFDGATFHLTVPRGLLASLSYFAAHNAETQNTNAQALLALLMRAFRKNAQNVSPEMRSGLFRAIKAKAVGASARQTQPAKNL